MADEVQDTTQTQAQPDISKEEIERLKAVAARFGPLSSIADALEQDPSRIYAIQAALEGRVPQAAPQSSQQQSAPQLTPQQMEELDNQMRMKPAETIAALTRIAMDQARREVMADAQPLLGTTADLVVQNFKGRKAAEDPLYRQILPLFDAELRDVGLPTLIQMDPATRMRTLELRWNSAAATVFRKAAVSKQADPPPNAGGSGGGTTPPKKGSMANPFLAALAAASGLSEEQMAQIDKELEEEQ